MKDRRNKTKKDEEGDRSIDSDIFETCFLIFAVSIFFSLSLFQFFISLSVIANKREKKMK